MPVVSFHVPEQRITPERGEQLTRRACEVFAEVLDAPVERIRAYIQVYPVWAGYAAGEAGAAPFYQFYVLADRSAEQVAALHQAFTDLLASVLEVQPNVIRGACLRVSPEDWGIAGQPASEIRKNELEARKQA